MCLQSKIFRSGSLFLGKEGYVNSKCCNFGALLVVWLCKRWYRAFITSLCGDWVSRTSHWNALWIINGLFWIQRPHLYSQKEKARKGCVIEVIALGKMVHLYWDLRIASSKGINTGFHLLWFIFFLRVLFLPHLFFPRNSFWHGLISAFLKYNLQIKL